mgnify:CR=1 FL=1
MHSDLKLKASWNKKNSLEPTKEPTPEPNKEPTKEPTPTPDPDPTPDPEKEAELALSETSKSIEVEETFDLTATVAAEFAVNKENVVQMVPANDGKSVKVTGVKEGEATITAAGNIPMQHIAVWQVFQWVAARHAASLWPTPPSSVT